MSKATQRLRNLWQALGSTRLAAILLVAVLLTSLLATLFPQMPVDPAAREPWLAAVRLRFGYTTRFLSMLGLFDAYRAPWFLALLVALLLSTCACTVQRWPRLWRSLSRPPDITQPDRFYLGSAHCAEWPVLSLLDGLSLARDRLTRHRYRIYIEQSAGIAYLYAEKGRWSQIGTLASHVAALLLVFALVARPALAWQETSVILLPEQVRPVGHGHDLAMRAGSLTVEYHPDGQPRDYRVPLTLLVNGSTLITRVVSINHPLTIRGVAFHLQGYGPANLNRYTIWQVSHDPTFGLAVGAVTLFLAAAMISLWVPYRRLWLRMDGQKAQMAGAAGFGEAFDALAAELAESCQPARMEGKS